MGLEMFGVVSRPDTKRKLEILSADAQYDLACACNEKGQTGRTRGTDGKWIYPVTLPNGGKSILFKTLVSNVCTNDCKYCPLRQQADVRRCSLGAAETVDVFLDYYRRKEVFGLFLSSGIMTSADATMERLNSIARILRGKHKYRGYIHLKVIPGASDAAIEEAVSLASAVSLNIETPGADNLAKLSNKKKYISDIIEPIKLISRLTARGNKYSRVKQTTQFIVGAADETDADIVKYTGGLYDRLNLSRVYFSAYQKQLGDKAISAGPAQAEDRSQAFVREHRLYQVDFLLRRYGFNQSEIIFGPDNNLSLAADPKQVWADNHPEFFPVEVNHAPKATLLRVPGLGPVTVNRILHRRRDAQLRKISDIGKVGTLLRKANQYLVF